MVNLPMRYTEGSISAIVERPLALPSYNSLRVNRLRFVCFGWCLMVKNFINTHCKCMQNNACMQKFLPEKPNASLSAIA